jgi:hypothetical protein
MKGHNDERLGDEVGEVDEVGATVPGPRVRRVVEVDHVFDQRLHRIDKDNKTLK